MIKTHLNLSVDEPEWEKALPDCASLSEQVTALATAFVEKHEPLDFFALRKPLSFNLCLGNDEQVHTLNREFRDMDKPTNILSFAAIDDEEFEQQLAAEDEVQMGDMIIALQTMQREAEEKGISLQHHFCHLLTHGVLHLLGYDHIRDDEAEHMEDFEVKILRQLNINNPYEE